MDKIEFNIELQPIQDQLWMLYQYGRATRIGFGGPRGGTKSHSADMLMLMRRIKYPQTNGLFIMRVYQDMLDIHIRPLFDAYPELEQGFNKQDMLLRLNNGSYIRFLSGENLETFQKRKGRGFADVMIDQSELFSKEEIEFLYTINRSVKTGITPKILLCFNPGNIGHCVPYGEVLTKTGWKEIKDIEVNEEVATLNDNDKIIFVPTSQTHKEYYRGELYQSDTGTAHICGTPNHRIARRTETKRKNGRTIHKGIKLTEIKDLPNYSHLVRTGLFEGKEIKEFILPEYKTRKLKLSQPLRLSGDNYCEFMGWFLTEGSATTMNEKVNNKRFCISQMKKKNRDEIDKLLKNDCGFIYSKTKSGFTVDSPGWWNYLRQFGKCRDKFVPDEIKQASTRQRNIFLQAMMKGDGHGIHFCTTSKRLADDVQEIAFKLGYSPRITSRQRINREGLSYNVSLRKRQNGYLYKNSFKKFYYEGMVYCLGIEKYHRFFIRQKGRIWLSGNSYHKRVFYDKIYEENENPEDFGYLQAKGWDNAYWSIKEMAQLHNISLEDLDSEKVSALIDIYHQLPDKERFEIFIKSDYGRNLNGQPEHKRRQELFGDMEIFEGMFFVDFRRKHHVIENYQLSNLRATIAGLDYGNVTALLVMQRDTEGTVVVAGECYLPDLTNPSDRANAIADYLLEKELYHLEIIYDTDMEISQLSNIGIDKTPITIFRDVFKQRMGRQAPKMRCVNKKSLDRNKPYRTVVNEAVKEYLKIRRSCLKCKKVILRETKCPECGLPLAETSKIYFAEEARYLVKFMGEAIYDPSDPSGGDFDRHQIPKKDHPYDGFKYGFMELYRPKEKPKDPRPNWLKGIQKKELAKIISSDFMGA